MSESHGAFAVHWLSLAATPTFAAMALLSFVGGDAVPICSAQQASPLIGMTAMYVLMSAFHCAPWLKLIFGAAVGAKTN